MYKPEVCKPQFIDSVYGQRVQIMYKYRSVFDWECQNLTDISALAKKKIIKNEPQELREAFWKHDILIQQMN